MTLFTLLTYFRHNQGLGQPVSLSSKSPCLAGAAVPSTDGGESMHYPDDKHAHWADQGVVILDDGAFYIELNCNYGTAEAAGFLQRRCYIGVTTPGGYECLGSFEMTLDGKWRASVDAPYSAATDSDSRELGVFSHRLAAITALWGARHEAYRRHADD